MYRSHRGLTSTHQETFQCLFVRRRHGGRCKREHDFTCLNKVEVLIPTVIDEKIQHMYWLYLSGVRMQQHFIHAMVLLLFSHFAAENKRYDLKIIA